MSYKKPSESDLSCFFWSYWHWYHWAIIGILLMVTVCMAIAFGVFLWGLLDRIELGVIYMQDRGVKSVIEKVWNGTVPDSIR